MFDINVFIDKFKTYTNTFLEDKENSNIKLNLEHKIRHSLNVLAHSKAIAKSEKFNEEDIFIAELCGLFHDIGRFEQFTKYKTFKDTDSIYHGELGVEVLKKEKFISELPDYIVEIVYCTTYTHGLIEIPSDVTGDKLCFSKLIRDADKLDIFSIIAKYYHTTGPRNIASEYGLSEDSVISADILQKFFNKEMISKSELSTFNDFKIMQLSWIFSLNFAYSREYIKNTRFIDSVLKSITDIRHIDSVSDFISKNISGAKP